MSSSPVNVDPHGSGRSVQNTAVPEGQKSTNSLRNPCWLNLQRHNAPDPQHIDENTRRAWNHALALLHYLESQRGTFVRDNSGELFILLNGKMISLHTDGVKPTHELEHLLFTHGLPGAASSVSKLVISYLQRFAYSCTDADVTAEKFVALKNDCIYIPAADGIVLISKDGVTQAQNVDNPDKVLVEPLSGQKPFTFIREQPVEGLRLFEGLVIDSQTVTIPAMAWLSAMQELFFPFISPKYEGERAIIAHTGPSNSAKTGSEKAFVRLHGFNEPTTKISSAELQNSRFAGILFLDNQEEHNLSPSIQDGLITMSSGGEKKVVGSHRRGQRPIVTFTTIEFSLKTELKNRAVEIKHSLTAEKMKSFSEQDHTEKVLASRDKIMSAVMYVIAEFARQARTEEEVPDGATKFSDNYRALCRLLRAYETTAQKPKGWADQIIAVWHQQLSEHSEGPANEDLGFIVRRFTEDRTDKLMGDGVTRVIEITSGTLLDGQQVSGTLFVAETTAFYNWARNNYPNQVPNSMSSSVFGRRLSEANTLEIRVLREEDVPKGSGLHAHLKHREAQKFVGFLKVKSVG